MTTIQRGNAIRLSVQFLPASGTVLLADVDAVLTSPAGVETPLTGIAAGVANAFYVDHLVDSVAELGAWSVRWQSSSPSPTITTTDSFTVTASPPRAPSETFASPQELRTFLTGETLDEVADAEWIAQAELLLELVSADIQTAARNRIIAGTDVAKLAGTWSRDLLLPRRPVVSVSSVTLNGYAIASSSFEWNDRSLVRAGLLGGIQGADHLVPGDGSHWGGPASTVEVAYAYGYSAATVPLVVKSLALRVAARSIDNPSGGVSQESLGPYSVSYRNTLDAGGSFVTAAEGKLLRRRFSTTAGTISAGSL